ncbi:MAG: glycosyltransferase family 1 protein, partial [Nanoarchaeota archaeon]|nr:glycosyltransferase family 1 protein [Nanoarchaeota archaeon]
IGGNSTYARELIYNLAKIDKKNQYFLYYYFHDFLLGRIPRETNNENFKSKSVCISQLKFPISSKIMDRINKTMIKAFSGFNRIDIFHFSDPLIFVGGSYKSIVTLHDLAVLHNSDWAKKSSLDFYKKNIKSILDKANKIIAVSNFTKNDAIKTLNIDEKKITVVYEGVDSIFCPSIDKNYLKEKFNLEKYILYVGALNPRKNIIGLLRAYGKLDIKLRERYNLVLVGIPRDVHFSEEINKNIEDLKISNQVKRFEKITNNDLPKIYSSAKLFVYPSFFEGFGLPVLESLSCEVPVIVSNTSSLPETVGSAGVLVNPGNIEEMKLAMEKMLLDDRFYQGFKSKCLEQSNKFKWQKTAEETLAVYEEVYKG